MLGYGQNSNNGYIFLRSIITRDIYSHVLLYFSLYFLISLQNSRLMEQLRAWTWSHSSRS